MNLIQEGAPRSLVDKTTHELFDCGKRELSEVSDKLQSLKLIVVPGYLYRFGSEETKTF